MSNYKIEELLERMRSPHNSLVTQSFLLNEGANVIEKLEAHIRVLLDNDPSVRLYPSWQSVLDVWRDEAKHILQVKGTDDG